MNVLEFNTPRSLPNRGAIPNTPESGDASFLFNVLWRSVSCFAAEARNSVHDAASLLGSR
jgi:hypothetical protein